MKIDEAVFSACYRADDRCLPFFRNAVFQLGQLIQFKLGASERRIRSGDLFEDSDVLHR